MPTRDLVRTTGLVPTGEKARGKAQDAEDELSRLIAQVAALDAEVDELSTRLSHFTAAYERRMREAFALTERNERLMSRLRVVQDELDRLIDLVRNPGRSRTASRPGDARSRGHVRSERRGKAGTPRYRWTAEEDAGAASSEPDEEEPLSAPADVEPEELFLKRLYRRLARLLHPDLAQTDEERERFHRLMSQVNDAYERRDRTTLELIAARVGIGVFEEGISEEERLTHLRKRIAMLNQVVLSLKRDLQRLKATSTFRLYEESERRRAEGRDYFAETLQELKDEAASAIGDAWSRIARIEAAARELSGLKQSLEQAPKEKRVRAFDPVVESPLVRLGVQQLERRRASAQARTLARELEEVAAQTPWHAALILQAFFAEVAGRPPEGFVSVEEWSNRYGVLRALWTGAPTFEEVLTTLPAALELGLRLHGSKLRFGIQLKAADLVAAVPIALERQTVARIAREVLRVAGPAEKCKRCGEERYLVHLLRTRGLDELHGLHCPACGELLKSYLLFNWGEGHESLLPYALQLGLVEEQPVKFSSSRVIFGLLPDVREGLTAKDLVDLFFELYAQPYGLELHPMALRVTLGKRTLAANAKIPRSGVPRISFARGTEPNEGDALELLRARIERRFKPR